MLLLDMVGTHTQVNKLRSSPEERGSEKKRAITINRVHMHKRNANKKKLPLTENLFFSLPSFTLH